MHFTPYSPTSLIHPSVSTQPAQHVTISYTQDKGVCFIIKVSYLFVWSFSLVRNLGTFCQKIKVLTDILQGEEFYLCRQQMCTVSICCFDCCFVVTCSQVQLKRECFTLVNIFLQTLKPPPQNPPSNNTTQKVSELKQNSIIPNRNNK